MLGKALCGLFLRVPRLSLSHFSLNRLIWPGGDGASPWRLKNREERADDGFTMLIARLGTWVLLTSFVASCATPERRLLATMTSLAHHEHPRRYESACHLRPSGVDTFYFECIGTTPVMVRCAVVGAAECCWVVDATEQEDRKCGERRRVATTLHYQPH